LNHIDRFHHLIDSTQVWLIGVFIGVAFAAIYLAYAWISLLATRHVLPGLGIGALIEKRPLAPGQVRLEIVGSLVSIAIFAVYGVISVLAERRGVITINWHPAPFTILVNLVLLTLWNEVHFYACHRFLHTRWLYRKVHAVHHRSIVPTPFSTFSFHWFEATLLSSVMILALLVWPLDIITIVIFPGISLIGNSIGHMNYAVFLDKSESELLAACQRHTAHHTRWSGNYGFYLPWLDQWLSTRVPGKRSSKN
jgi:lathosterol oxidase